jgi:Gram-negative bacterial TonB protein C-terminal
VNSANFTLVRADYDKPIQLYIRANHPMIGCTHKLSIEAFAMKVLHLRPLSSVVLLLFSVVLATRSVVRADSPVPPRSASRAEQNTDMDLLASQLVEKLNHADVKTVAVNRFYGKKIGRSLTYKLSDNFSSAFAKSAGHINILDRASLVKALQEKSWMAIDLDDSLVFRSIAVSSGADAVIQGSLKLEGKFVELSLKALNASTEKKIAEVKTKILVPQGMDDLLEEPVQDPLTGVYLAGVGGVTAPTCTYCPQPEFSSESRQKHVWEAKNVFRITVRSDGRTADIRLVTPAGYGLDENSAAALQHWQLSPAHLPNGTAVPSRVDIEIAYHGH